MGRCEEQMMSPQIEEAAKRLQAALGSLEAAFSRRFSAEHRRSDLETELQVMQDDRARLAVELESAAARLSTMETTTEHVGQRVQNAIVAIQDVISRTGVAHDSREA